MCCLEASSIDEFTTVISAEWLFKKSSMDAPVERDYKEVMHTCTQRDNICSYTNTKLAVLTRLNTDQISGCQIMMNHMQ